MFLLCHLASTSVDGFILLKMGKHDSKQKFSNLKTITMVEIYLKQWLLSISLISCLRTEAFIDCLLEMDCKCFIQVCSRDPVMNIIHIMLQFFLFRFFFFGGGGWAIHGVICASWKLAPNLPDQIGLFSWLSLHQFI